MKKLAIFISMFFMCFVITAETYKISGITGMAKGKDGILKTNSVLTDEDEVVVLKGNIIYLENNLEINKSGKVKDVIEKRKLKKKGLTFKKINPSVDNKSINVITASSRASEAKSDFEWEE